MAGKFSSMAKGWTEVNTENKKPWQHNQGQGRLRIISFSYQYPKKRQAHLLLLQNCRY
jgi:hypothetical protein